MPTTPSQAARPAWRLQDAKSQFSALVDNAMRGVPQHVTRRGKQSVVVLSELDFEALQRSAASRADKPASFVEHLLAMPKMPVKARSEATVSEAAEGANLDLQPRAIDFS